MVPTDAGRPLQRDNPGGLDLDYVEFAVALERDAGVLAKPQSAVFCLPTGNRCV